MADIAALHVARVDGKYYVMDDSDKPAHALHTAEAAATLLLSGASVWIKADDRASLAAALRADIRSVKTKGASNGAD